MNTNVKKSEVAFTSFKCKCKELSKNTLVEIWDNDLTLFHIKKVTKNGLEGLLINGGIGTPVKECTISDVPKKYYDDVTDTGLLVVRKGVHYLTDNRLLTDLCKAAGIGGDAVHEPSLERDVFLEYCLLERIKDRHKAIIRKEGPVYRLLALRKPRFAVCDAKKLAELAEDLVNDGFSFTDWKADNLTKNGLISFTVELNGVSIRISDSQTGDSSFTVEGGYFTENDNFVSIENEHFIHRSEIDMEEVKEVIKEIHESVLSIFDDIHKKQDAVCPNIYSIWERSILRERDGRKALHTPSVKSTDQGIMSLKDGIDYLNDLFDKVDFDFASKREISESMGDILKRVIKGASLNGSV